MAATSSQALFSAIDAGDLERLAALLDQDPAVVTARGEQGVSTVLHALYHQQPRIADLLATRAAPLGWHESAGMGDVDQLRQHLQFEPELLNAWSPDGFTALQLAAFFGRRAAAEFLLQRGAQTALVARHPFGITALHAALAGPDPDIARPLIEAGADVNARQQGGFTPLHAAAQNGLVDLARLLVERGGRADAAADDGRTPLDVARDDATRAVLART